MDELLKTAMQNDIAPDDAVRKALRKKVEEKKHSPIIRYLNADIKLYQAVLAVAAVAVVIILLRPVGTGNNSNNISGGTLVADTSIAGQYNTLKQDSFLVRNFSTTVY